MDPISIIEASYHSADAEDSWLRTIAEAAKPALDRGDGLAAFILDFRDKKQLRARSVVDLGMPSAVREIVVRTMNADRSPVIDDVVATTFLGPNSAFVMSETAGLEKQNQFAAMFDFSPTRDVTVVRALAPDGFVCIVAGFHLVGQGGVSRREAERWNRLAAHISAGLRLRIATRDQAEGADGEAVVTPSGKVEHAVGPAKEPEALASLRAAAVAVDRARGAMRREDPDEAVSLWRGLVEGRWSLVDRFDHDGKRMYVARRNDPGIPAPTTLSERDRQIVAYAAMGLGNKEIAYALGLSAGTIGERVASAMEKLGLRSRAELVRLARALIGG
jgi:DNA-binding CsgD family transcriptional regulator